MDKQAKDRLTVTETVYHQTPGEEASFINSNFSRELEVKEEPYTRRCTATEEWQPLDLGWLKDLGVGMLVIRNEQGKIFDKIPTAEEREEEFKRVLQLRYRGDHVNHFWIIPPTETIKGCPSQAESLLIRSAYKTAKYSLFLVPK